MSTYSIPAPTTQNIKRKKVTTQTLRTMKQAGEPVNLEVDVVAKYVEKLLGAAR